MSVLQMLTEIEEKPRGVFITHERTEKKINVHAHQKGQLSFVRGGIAYITINKDTYIIPTRHFCWIPAGIGHAIKVGNTAAVLHSLYFYTHDDDKNSFYGKLGIYPANELLVQMILFTEKWDDRLVDENEENFEFLIALKNILPQISNKALPLVLPFSENERMIRICDYLERNIAENITLTSLSSHFNISERTMSRFFQSELKISFLQYFKTLRMVKAIELLLKTDYSIGEIAEMVGYDTLAAFSHVFFEMTHTRPLEMRKTKST